MGISDPLVVHPPKMRAAYSDRTAWLMALLSEFGYDHYEKEAWDVDALAIALTEVRDDVQGLKARLAEFRDQVRNPAGQGRLPFEAKLVPGGFRLVDIFDRDGTQGFLAFREADAIAVLVFRGTEKNFKDIATDVCAWQDRGGAHTGFRIAYESVKPDVVRALQALPKCQLYITGHSLGGALAMMAAHHLSKTKSVSVADEIAACYTFGGPKIGDREFTSTIKPPIYRVVHGADIVPWLPFNFAQVAAVLAWVLKLLPISRVADAAHRWLSRYFNHVHHGDARLLVGGDDDEPRVVQNPTALEQLARVATARVFNWRRCYEDHSIRRYCEKLEGYARLRNSEQPATQAPSTNGEATA